METTEIFYALTTDYYLWIGHNPSDSDYCYIVNCYHKLPNGNMKHLVTRLDEYKGIQTNYEILRETLERTYTTPRPYQAGQACDGSIDAPVMVLVDHFLKSKGLDTKKIYDLAYEQEDKYTPEEIEEIIAFGNWQGVSIPSQWDSQALDQLMDSINAINNKSLWDYFFNNFHQPESIKKYHEQSIEH